MKRVIIVEDDQLLALVEERLITKLGYEVIGKAATGSKALELIHDLKPDFIVTDQNLSDDITGMELLKELRDQDNPTPVILLTGESCFKLKEQATQYDNTACLFKPVTMDSLRVPLEKAAIQASEIAIYAA